MTPKRPGVSPWREQKVGSDCEGLALSCVKKLEGTRTLNLLLKVMVVMTLASLSARGQTPADDAVPTEGEVPPVPVTGTPQAPSLWPLGPFTGDPLADPTAEPVLRPTIANAPLETPAASRALNIGAELVGGAVVGTVLAIGGAFALPSLSLAPLGRGWTGAAVGLSIGVPVGVLLAGWLFDGHGAWWAALLGDVAGLLVGGVATFLGGAQGAPLLFALPLGTTVLGYELTSNINQATVAPVVSVGRDAASLGLMGRF